MELATIGLIAALVIVIAYNTFKILKEYERGVVFFLGRFQKVKGPGLIILIPGLQKMVKVDLRVIVLDVPTQDVISRDNVSVRVNAVIYFRIVDPEKAVIRVANVFEATSQLSQTTLRSVLGQHELDDMLAERDRLNEDIQGILDQRTDNWGIKVANVEIKHVDLDESMIRAIAQQAEAERRGNKARRSRREHDPRDRPAGRSGTCTARQGHQRRRRKTGSDDACRSGGHAGSGGVSSDAPVPADAQGNRQRKEQHDRVPDRAGRKNRGCGQGA
jgi:regulator of protease activity HflC (stomatin/prohibitin superfamily)